MATAQETRNSNRASVLQKAKPNAEETAPQDNSTQLETLADFDSKTVRQAFIR